MSDLLEARAMSGKPTPGPWALMAGRGNGPNGARIICRGQVIATVSVKADCSADEKWANARLLFAAPAQAIILDLLRLGLAKFEPGEFCFNGLRYSQRGSGDCWNALLDVIGWDAARAAIQKAEGSHAG